MRSIGNTLGNQARKLKAVASGALPNGDPVVVNSDGTVSVVEETSISQSLGSSSVFNAAGSDFIDSIYDEAAQKVVVVCKGSGADGTAVVGTVTGTSISFGTPVVFAGNAQWLSCAYDPDTQQIIVAYQNPANSNFGTAIVGAVSGTSISFGSASVFESAVTYRTSTVYDEASQKVVISYVDGGNSNYGTAVVGTVSGTSISFGTPTVFESAATAFNSSTYDANAQKVVLAYKDGGDSDKGKAIVGTVSGTSISFGTAAIFATPRTEATTITYDASAQKVVIAYLDRGASDLFHGTAIVGTVSGTSISFGTAVVFEAATTGDEMSIDYDSVAQKVVISYRDTANSNYGNVIVGTVSGTSISFGDPVIFNAASTDYTSITYDPSSKTLVVFYHDNGNSSYGTGIVFQNAQTVKNLTAENYIGIASNGYADTQGATIDTQGSINSGQSGLTAGQAYYVQTDGTLNTTPDDTSVFAGTALTATKLLVKG